jgi:hypothetical protein
MIRATNRVDRSFGPASTFNPVAPPENAGGVFIPVAPPENVFLPVQPPEAASAFTPVQPPEVGSAFLPVQPPDVPLVGGGPRGVESSLLSVRFYNPNQGRFMTRSPANPSGTNGDGENAGGGYGFGGNNPTSSSPLGGSEIRIRPESILPVSMADQMYWWLFPLTTRAWVIVTPICNGEGGPSGTEAGVADSRPRPHTTDQPRSLQIR